MEVFRYGLRPAQRDARGQQRIGTEHPGARAALHADIEMRDLAARVDAGVGAAGTDDLHRRIGDRG